MDDLHEKPSRGRRRALLLSVARSLAAETEPSRVLRVLLREAQRAVGGSGGSVSQWNESQRQLVELWSSIPLSPATVSIQRYRGASAQAAEHRQTVVTNDYQHYEYAVPRLVKAGIQAALAVPILHAARLLGVVLVLSDQPGKLFTPQDAELLEMFASMSASTLVALDRKRSEEQRRLQAEFLERLTETTSDAIIVIDSDLILRAWNRGAEQLYGWSRDEVLGKQPPFIPPERRDATLQLWRRVLESAETIANYEEERLTKSGSIVSIMATISPMTDETGSVVGMLGIAKDLSGRKVIEEQRKMLGRMEEREMLAMDLHDNIVQAIYGAVLGIGAVERTLALDARQTLATLHQVKTQLNATIHELRSYIFDLRRAEATRGASLSAGLQAIAEELRTYSLVHVELAVDERAEGVIGPALVDQLLAVAREATSNVIQHAAASALTLRVGLEDRRIVLDVMDDGLGFESGTAPPSAGHGLINMSQRVQRVGGQLSVESRRGQGTRLRVQVPVADRPD